MIEINPWRRIAHASEYYEDIGYRYTAVGWITSPDVTHITRPAGVGDVIVGPAGAPWGVLVASGEQSLLEMRHGLTPGRYHCVTPCFRDEPAYDEMHHHYFLKLELMAVLESGDCIEEAVRRMCQDARDYFEGEGADARILGLGDGCDRDITVGGIEVGSYGYREHGGFRWCYGTGLAEPRFSYALARQLGVRVA